MVQPEFKDFNFVVNGTEKFYVLSKGKKYLDFTGSAMTTGYNFIKPSWLISPVSKLVFKNPYTEKLKDMLTRSSGFDKIAFTTSGTEACDAALSRFGPTFVSFEGAYHGLTYITKIVSNGTGIDKENRVVHLIYPNRSISDDNAIEMNEGIISDARKDLKMDGSSIIVELIQSDGGVNIMTSKFANYISEIVSEYNMHLIIDEVYTAYGRSGELFLFKKYNLSPEMVCVGKGMAAGLPAGAVLYNGDWTLPHNEVISMQSANMFVGRIGVEVLKRLNEKRLEFIRDNGKSIIEAIRNIKGEKIIDVRGRGFMIGVELTDTATAYNIRNKLEKKGVLCSLVGEKNNVLKITPPAFIDELTLKKGIKVIISTLNELSDENENKGDVKNDRENEKIRL
ncbi:MAG: aminotransferase class III-fold pyridoxal phosphate-dependent enzyme [Nitrososphaeria archaeon]